MRFTRVVTSLLLLTLCLSNLSHAEAPSARLAPALDEQSRIDSIDDSAEVLYALEKAEFEEDGRWQRISYFSIRINSLEAARDYGRIVIPFDHYYSDINLDFANARSKAGKITAVAQDAVQHRITGGGQDFYSDSSELVFSLPNVVPGSIIEFQYTQSSKALALPDLFASNSTPWYFQRKIGGDGWRGDTVRHYQYELRSPTTTKLHFKYFNGFPKTLRTTKESNKTVRTWSWQDVPSFHTEAWMPPFHKVAAMLQISTHKDWSVVDAWTWKNVEDKLKSTAELQAIVKNLNLPKAASRQEKIRAVYSYLQSNIRYVFAHLGRGGYEPHFPDEVVKANYGDCKDQTVLAIALLRILEIDALPALIETPSSGQSDSELVELIFDHMLVYIPENNDSPAMYMDTTGDRMLFPGVSNYLENQNTLIVNGKGGLMTQMQSDFSPSFVHLHIDYDLNERKQPIASVEIELSGFFEQNTRSWWTNSNDRESNLNSFVKGLYSSSLDFDVTASLINSENLWQPVKIQADYIFNDPDDEQHIRAASFSQINYLFGSGSNLPLPETRKLGFYDDTEYDLYMTVDFLDIKGLQPFVHSQGENKNSRWFTLTQAGMDTDRGYRVNINYHKPQLILNKQEYSDYYNEYSRLASTENWLIGFTSLDESENLSQLEELKENFGEDSFEYQLAFAEFQIDQGNFEQALDPAKKAVDLDNKSGKAWYVLAMAQGFNSRIEESKIAFAKAKKLGYKPW